MQTSIYIPDDLYDELKAHDAQVSQIARAAFEEWLANNASEADPTAALRMIETGVKMLRTQIAQGALKAAAVKPTALKLKPKGRPRKAFVREAS